MWLVSADADATKAFPSAYFKQLSGTFVDFPQWKFDSHSSPAVEEILDTYAENARKVSFGCWSRNIHSFSLVMERM